MGLAVGSSRTRWAAVIGLCLLFFALQVVAPSMQTAAYAQDAAGGTPAAPKAPGSLIWHIIYSAGWVFGPLLLIMSIGLVAVIVLLAMDLRMNVAVPPGFVEQFTDTVNKRKFNEAFQMARNDNSFLARVMTAGMGRLQYGIEDAREAAFNMTDSIKAGKETLITYLATIGTLGPLIGLVGTVFGMVKAFMVLRSAEQAKFSELADSLSHALVITLLGVALAVPAIFAHAIFRSRLMRMSLEVSNIADDLLTQMYHNSKRPAPAPTNAAVAAGASGVLRPG